MQLHFTPRESEKLLATRSKILLNPGTSDPGLLQVAVKICFALYQTGRKQVEICILTLETTGKVFLPLFFFFFLIHFISKQVLSCSPLFRYQ